METILFSKPFSPFTKQKPDRSEGTEDFPCFNLNYEFLERFSKKPLTLASTRNRKQSIAKEKMAEGRETSKSTSATQEEPVSIVAYKEDKLETFKENMASENTQKSTSTAVRRLQSWHLAKYKTELNLNSISKAEAPQLLKHFFVEIRKTKKDDEGKEYEPCSLQTYRNGIRRYFLHRPCPPAPDNFDIGKNEEFDEVANMLSVKKKDLKRKSLGNKPNTAQPLEEDEIEKIIMAHRSTWPSKSSLASPSCLVEQCHAPWHASFLFGISNESFERTVYRGSVQQLPSKYFHQFSV